MVVLFIFIYWWYNIFNGFQSKIIMFMIGKNIKKLREQRGVSQDRLSKLADISSNTIAKLELDNSPNPTIDTLQKIAKALNVEVNDLIN